ncbi:UDP-2,4-diacetamido-2,4,6-trideoxy-beta-L-altropyranose hydrolase [Marinilabilia rubra]|uniref:UDP-2,4-diacetamido-2,4, 6-trideoxy-beta-L-altropyranose hydrolase n=1 Tax=Marinilabilia rubra TaxID=2162893 RepID=UPI0011B25CBD|nr:UDP-2,4-diacetamido-2,4,6-trideoxy-beta-L-altropyranose hydrolase [Marinilabilia rubra]
MHNKGINSQKTRIVFRADGDRKIGMGHFVRTLALADMLKEDFYCVFATVKPSSYQEDEVFKVCEELIVLPEKKTHFEDLLKELTGHEIVVLDNYYFSTNHQNKIKSIGCKLVCIDDVHDKHYESDIVLNHAPINPGGFSLSPKTKLLLGLDYVLLRPPFFTRTKRKGQFIEFRHVFLNFGGADFKNLTGCWLRELATVSYINEISIVVGDAFMQMHELSCLVEKNPLKINIYQNVDANKLVSILQTIDLAIVPCSTILYEVISQDVPVVTGYFVDNQKEIASCLKGRYEHVYVLGNLEKVEIREIHKFREKVKNSKIIGLNLKHPVGKLKKEFLALNQRN